MNNLRFALRSLLKTPGFTTIAIVTLALGIGLNTSMFSLMKAILWGPVKFPVVDQVVRVYRTTPQSQNASLAHATFLDLQRESKEAIRLAAYLPWSLSLAEPGQPATLLSAVRVTTGFFEVVGVQPALGRAFTDDEDNLGRNNVVVLSHATWQKHFGGAADIIDRTVRIESEQMTVIGVMPESFNEVRLWGPGELYRPIGLTEIQKNSRTEYWLRAIGRYAPGVSPAQADARLQAVMGTLARDHPETIGQDGIRAIPVVEAVQNPANTMITLLLIGLSAFVLLIACANLANLQLTRALARAREFAIRAALGASRRNLIAAVIHECLVLAALGGALGVLIASWCNEWMVRALAVQDGDFQLPLDWKVIGFAFGVSVFAGLAFGSIPAWLSSKVRVNDALKSGARGTTGDRTRTRIRSTLIVGQFALALMLLASAGLFIRGIDRLVAKERGWNLDQVIQGVIQLPDAKYPDAAARYSFYTRLEESLAALPGAECATVTWNLPVRVFGNTQNYVVAGRDQPVRGQEPLALVNGITPSYLQTTRIKLVAGRAFTAADGLEAPLVALINESMAQTLFPDENPVGQRISSVTSEAPQWVEIVGVVQDIETINLGPPPTPFQVYRPLAQDTWSYVTVAIRAHANPGSLAEPFRRTIAGMDPDLPVRNLATVDEVLEQNLSGFSVVNPILSGFAVLGMFMAALGIYGVIAHAVVQRTPEIGIRLALGAQVNAVMRLIVSGGLRLAVLGVVIGLAGAYAINRLVSSVLPLFPSLEPTTIALLAGTLVAVAFAACYVPARRATRINPVDALRAD